MQEQQVFHSQRFQVSPLVAEAMDLNRQRGHHHVMSAFRRGLGHEPRSEVGALWHLNRSVRQLTVQAREMPESAGLLGDIVSSDELIVPEGGSRVTLSLARNVQKTPPSRTPEELRPLLKQGKAYRSALVTVPECDRRIWAVQRLATIGFTSDPETLEIGPLRHAVIGPRERIPFVDISVSGVVHDADSFELALQSGTGKGRNYGLGLIRLH